MPIVSIEHKHIMKGALLMKRVVVIFMIFVALFSTASAAKIDPDKTFSYKALEKLDGYKYDKFTKTWSYYQAYIREYSDAIIVLGIQLDGEGNNLEYPPTLYAKILNPSGTAMYIVKSVDILIDDTVYSYNKMLEGETESSVLLGPSSIKLVEALAKANSASFKLTWSSGSISEDISKKEYATTLKAVCSTLIKQNVWHYVQNDDSTISLFETLYPLSISD